MEACFVFRSVFVIFRSPEPPGRREFLIETTGSDPLSLFFACFTWAHKIGKIMDQKPYKGVRKTIVLHALQSPGIVLEGNSGRMEAFQ